MPTITNLSLLTLCEESDSFLHRLKAFEHVLMSLYEQGCTQDVADGFSLLFNDLVASFVTFSQQLETLSKGGKPA